MCAFHFFVLFCPCATSIIKLMNYGMGYVRIFVCFFLCIFSCIWFVRCEQEIRVKDARTMLGNGTVHLTILKKKIYSSGFGWWFHWFVTVVHCTVQCGSWVYTTHISRYPFRIGLSLVILHNEIDKWQLISCFWKLFIRNTGNSSATHIKYAEVIKFHRKIDWNCMQFDHKLWFVTLITKQFTPTQVAIDSDNVSVVRLT